MKIFNPLLIIMILVMSVFATSVLAEDSAGSSLGVDIDVDDDADDSDDDESDDDTLAARARADSLRRARLITAQNIKEQRENVAQLQRRLAAYVKENIDEFDNIVECNFKVRDEFPDAHLDSINRLCAPHYMKTIQDHLRERGFDDDEIEDLLTIDEEERKKIFEMNKERLKRLAKLSKERLQAAAKLSRAKIRYLADLSEDDLEDEDIEGLVREQERFQNQNLVGRSIAMDRRAASVKAEDDAKRGISAFKKYLDDDRDFLKGSTGRLQQCKEDPSEECDDYRNQVLARSQKYLINFANIVMKHAEQAKARVEGSTVIDDELAAELIADMDAIIAEMEEARELAENAEDKDDLREVAASIKEKWGKAKHMLHHANERLRIHQYGNIIAKAAQLEEKLEGIKERLEDSGLEVEGFDELIVEFSESIELAKEEYGLAMEALESYKAAIDDETTDEDTDALLETVKEHIKNAREALEHAQEKLREIVKKISASGGEIDDPDRPSYKPGEDLGFYIWQKEEVWHICASGDGEWHRFKAEINVDGNFCRVAPLQYERNDHLRKSPSALVGWGAVGPHQDCLRFTTNSEEVSFELAMDPYDLATDADVEGRYYGDVTLEGETAECDAADPGPVPCTMEYMPVCGLDGESYSNRCELDAAGIDLAYDGECQSDDELEEELGIEA